jgi:two-component system OmpR family response regulator
MRLLVVEDEDRLAALLKQGLGEAGYLVDVAGSGEDAGWMARATEYDGILLDVMLPGSSGFDVCAKLRADGVATPVLMLTARTAVDDRVRGLDAGADDYLLKPFSFEELLARVRALVRRGAPATTPVLVVGDLRLDPATHTVERGGERIELSPKEFVILELLMRRAGRVLSRFEILEGAWDGEAEHSSNVIDVYIRRIRDHIDRPFGSAVLETVRGAGYRLRTDEGAWARRSPDA